MFFIGFFSGMVVGISLVALIFLFVSFKQKKILKKDEFTKLNIEEDEIISLIKKKRDFILKGKSLGFRKSYERTAKSIEELIEEIAITYFPNSKYPKYELTIEEILMLNIHISRRLVEQLDKRRYKLLRELRLSQILYMNDAKNTIMQNNILQKINKYKIVDVVRNGWIVYNITNPIFLLKKVMVAGGTEFVYRSFGVIILNTVGEEVNKVYSKSFKDAKEFFEKEKLIEYNKKN